MEHAATEFAQRCRGDILATAFGDDLGLPVEGLTAEQVRRQHGLVTDYLPIPATTPWSRWLMLWLR